MSENKIINKIGIIRLERLFFDNTALTSSSSFVNWLNGATSFVGSITIIAPIKKIDVNTSDLDTRFSLRTSDKLLAIPNSSGYIRVLFLLPVIFTQLLRMRLCQTIILCRAPEHGNAFILPLLRLLKFKIVIWVVGNRKDILRASIARRGDSLRVRIGAALNRITGLIEDRFLVNCPAIVNGGELARYVKTLQDKKNHDRILQVVSTTMNEKELQQKVFKNLENKLVFDILYVGRIATDKGLDDLICAFDICAKSHNSKAMRLRLVGWSSQGEEERLREKVWRFGLGELVEFCGPKKFGDELFEVYRSSDLFVLPSHSEGTPRVLIEAMAFGLPIVSTNVGGIPDIVKDGRNGFLVKPHDELSLAQRILELKSDNHKYREISENNLNDARAFSVENMCKRMFTFINEISKCEES